MGNVLVWFVWIVAAFACLASGIAVISFRNPFFSALALIGNLASLAVLYLLLSAEFVAAAQVLVYAGAVMVMFLFVIAYLGGHADAPWAGGPKWQSVGAVAAGAALLGEIVTVIAIDAGGGEPRGRDAFSARGTAVNGPDTAWSLAVAGVLFATGALGVLIRRSPLIVLLSLEIMLNGGNLALIAMARHAGNLGGQIFALAVMAVAASEVVVGLGLIVAIARRRLDLDVDRLSTLRG